jgi:hypothetical protein
VFVIATKERPLSCLDLRRGTSSSDVCVVRLTWFETEPSCTFHVIQETVSFGSVNRVFVEDVA